jgi:osmotically-inducible protein OsmY
MEKSDAQLKQDVLHELHWDTRVDEAEVGVEVNDGIVTLTGAVTSWAKRMAAEDAAHRVSGVLDVADEIKVKVPGAPIRDDTDIARAVRQALEWDIFVPAERIRSTVSGGKVTLEGDVDFWAEANDAERAVRNLVGVRWVTNNILIRPQKLDSEEVRKSIGAALERQAENEAKAIRIDVSEGRVSLSGVVHSWAEKDATLWAARTTSGVHKVDDFLSVDPHAP